MCPSGEGFAPARGSSSLLTNGHARGLNVVDRHRRRAAVGGRAKTFVDRKGRLLAMGRAEAARLGPPWSRAGGWKRSLRKNDTLRGDALVRLKGALVSAR